jgi:outer membrane protein assembly factor BamB
MKQAKRTAMVVGTAWALAATASLGAAATNAPPSAAKATGGRPAAGTTWPTFHGAGGLSGYTSAKLPDALARLWRYESGSAVSATPVCDGERVFAVNSGDQIFALDMKGTKLWAKKIAAPAAPEGQAAPASESFSAPLICAKGVVVAAAASGLVVGLNGKDGAEKWRYDAGAAIQGTPNFAVTGEDLRVFVITQPEGVVSCVDGATGKELWKAGAVARTDGHIAVGDGLVVFGSCDSSFHGLDVASGKEVSNVPVGEGSEMAGGMAVSGKQAFSGNRGGRVVGVDLAESKVLWSNEDGQGEMFITPAVTGDRVLFAAGDGNVYCADRAGGKKMWAYETGGTMLGAPVVADDKVVVCADGKIHLLRLKDGTKISIVEVSDTITSPAVVAGLVIVGSDAGHVIAFGTAGK